MFFKTILLIYMNFGNSKDKIVLIFDFGIIISKTFYKFYVLNQFLFMKINNIR